MNWGFAVMNCEKICMNRQYLLPDSKWVPASSGVFARNAFGGRNVLKYNLLCKEDGRSAILMKSGTPVLDSDVPVIRKMLLMN